MNISGKLILLPTPWIDSRPILSDKSIGYGLQELILRASGSIGSERFPFFFLEKRILIENNRKLL